jgi:DNA-binding NtrC family response regulator
MELESVLSDSSPQILLVDDDRALLEAFPETLRLRLPDVRLDVCDSAALALERIRTTEYHAIVSDLTMPGRQGLALLGEVKRERPWAPVLFMTGRTEQSLLAQALENGAYEFILKPIARDQAVLSIKRALDAHMLRAYCMRQDALATQISQQLRQLQQIMRPLLLSSFSTLRKELGDDRMEQSRTTIENALALSATQCRAIRRRLDFVEQFLQGTKQRLDSAQARIVNRAQRD